MGKLIIKNNGYTTEIVNGVSVSGLTNEVNTNYLGFNPLTNVLESLNPSGQTINYDGSYFEVTYDELYSLYTGSTLSPGRYYVITDYQTCYDQPKFDNEGSPITTGNYKTGSTEPLMVLATDINNISSRAISLLYPEDQILYDVSFTLTEVTSSPAKGRIYERIDNLNNRADYDFRAVQFIRYVGYFSENYYEGKINVTSSDGLVTGFSTTFLSSFVVGDILGVYEPFNSPMSCFRYYEITSISGDTEMYITGRTIADATNTYYSIGRRLPDYMSPYQCNITGTTNDDFAEYYTFNDGNNQSTYLGNFDDWGVFLLSNNVFLSGSYRGNYFAEGVEGNTFNDDMDSNTCGTNFKFNIITNDFDDNTVGSDFRNNIIDCDMAGNVIGNSFTYNMLGDADLNDFDYNTVGAFFERNFFTMNNNDFRYNNIGSYFTNNIVDSGFVGNIITADFYNNVMINNSFNDNTIGQGFYDNTIGGTFEQNTINRNFYNNTISNTFQRNSISSNIHNNNILSIFEDNNIGYNFYQNTITGSTTVAKNTFIANTYNNSIFDCNFQNNYFNDNVNNNTIYCNSFVYNKFNGNTFGNTLYYPFENNNVGSGFESNSIGDSITLNQYSFDRNTIKDTYKSNDINICDFTGNDIGNEFLANTINSDFMWNNIDSGFFLNIISGVTRENTIGTFFQSNIIQGTFQYNKIGNNFTSNTVGDGFGFGGGSYRGNVIGNNFHNNTIGEYFYDNTIGDNFATNTVGNTFQINRVTNSVELTDFSSATFVYGYYNCEIFRNSVGSLRLLYYDSSDVPTITNITD